MRFTLDAAAADDINKDTDAYDYAYSNTHSEGGEEKDVVKLAKELFDIDKEAWGDVYNSAQADLKFLSDDETAQWTEGDYNSRVQSGRPALTLDKLGQFTRQVANQIRLNTPSINIIPADGSSDDRHAMGIKGLIKKIEYKSSADDAYDTGVLSSIRCSIGFIRVDHDYVDDESFDQEMKIDRVVNPLSCWIDSASVLPDGSDAKHGFIVDKIRLAEFQKKYKGKAPVNFDTGKEEEGDHKSGVYVTIVEFFKIEEEESEIAVYDDGNGGGEVVAFDKNRDDEPLHKRTVKKKTVKRYKLSGSDILEETTFPGIYVPIVPVYGEEFWLDGKRNIFSLIRKAKTAQQLHNYWKSLETELLMKAPQAPVMAAEGQTEDYAEDWVNPNKSMVLRYKQTDLDGNPAPMPQRLPPPMTPTGIFNASLATVDDIKAALGMYGSSIGQQTNETSGIAIQRRKQEGEIGTYHFSDNLVKSITHVGRIIVSAIPEIYDTARIVGIIGAEDESMNIGLNGAVPENEGADMESYDFSKGKYEVRVVTGPSFTTLRQESSDFMAKIIQSQPELMQVAGDLVFKDLDVRGAEAISERIKRTIPPEIIGGDGENGEEDQDPEKMQLTQKLQEAVANIQMMQQEVAKMEELLKSKQEELAIKAQSEQSKAEYEKMKAELDMMRLQLEEQKVQFDSGLKQEELRLKAKELELKELEIRGQFLIDSAAQEAQQEEREHLDTEQYIEGIPVNGELLDNGVGDVISTAGEENHDY